MAGLAEFNPEEYLTILNDSPEGHTSVYIYRQWGFNYLKRCYLEKNCITETLQVTEGRI
jgi:hypothetical protein